MRNVYRVLVGKCEVKRLLGRPRCRWEEIILEWILKKQIGRIWTGFIWLRMGNNGRLL
jgi:hypothetical protein